MPATPRKRPLGAEQRRALQFLGGIPFGATDAAISANDGQFFCDEFCADDYDEARFRRRSSTSASPMQDVGG
jgi:hypothetical protein